MDKYNWDFNIEEIIKCTLFLIIDTDKWTGSQMVHLFKSMKTKTFLKKTLVIYSYVHRFQINLIYWNACRK